MENKIETLGDYLESCNWGMSKKEREWLDGRKITGFVKTEEKNEKPCP